MTHFSLLCRVMSQSSWIRSGSLPRWFPDATAVRTGLHEGARAQMNHSRSHFLLTTASGAVAAIILISMASTSPVTAAPEYSEWSAPINLGPVVNSGFNDIAPALSKDGLSLYFQSNRPIGSAGGLDLWVSQRTRRRCAMGSHPSTWGPRSTPRSPRAVPRSRATDTGCSSTATVPREVSAGPTSGCPGARTPTTTSAGSHR